MDVTALQMPTLTPSALQMPMYGRRCNGITNAYTLTIGITNADVRKTLTPSDYKCRCTEYK